MDYEKFGSVERAALVQVLWKEAYDAVVVHHDLERLRRVLELLREVVEV